MYIYLIPDLYYYNYNSKTIRRLLVICADQFRTCTLRIIGSNSGIHIKLQVEDVVVVTRSSFGRPWRRSINKYLPCVPIFPRISFSLSLHCLCVVVCFSTMRPTDLIFYMYIINVCVQSWCYIIKLHVIPKRNKIRDVNASRSDAT